MKRWLLLVIALVIVVIGFMYIRRAGAVEKLPTKEEIATIEQKVATAKKTWEDLKTNNAPDGKISAAFDEYIKATGELNKKVEAFERAQSYPVHHAANALYDVERGL